MFNSNSYNNNYSYNNPNGAFPQTLGNPNSFQNNFNLNHSIIEQQQNNNLHNTMHDNLHDNIKNEFIKEYQITVDSNDRNILTYPNQFAFRLSMGSNSAVEPVINRNFRNVKYVKIDSIILPTKSDLTDDDDNEITTINERFIMLKLNGINQTSQLGTNTNTNSASIIMYPKKIYANDKFVIFKPVNKVSNIINIDDNNLINLNNIEFNLLDGKYEQIDWVKMKLKETETMEEEERKKEVEKYMTDISKQIIINLRVGVVENKLNTEVNYR